MAYVWLAREWWWPGLRSKRWGLYLGTHTAGDRRQVLDAGCHTWPVAIVTSYHSEDLEEPAWAGRETVCLPNPLPSICCPALRSHGCGCIKRLRPNGTCVMQQWPLEGLSAEWLSPPLLGCLWNPPWVFWPPVLFCACPSRWLVSVSAWSLRQLLSTLCK